MAPSSREVGKQQTSLGVPQAARGQPKTSLAAAQRTEKTTVRASLSGTFLQTLPELVTPLKGHSLSFRAAVHRRCQRPPKGLDTLIKLWKLHNVQART